MDQILMEDKAEKSVWRVAATAIAVFVAIVVVASFFGGAETIAVANR